MRTLSAMLAILAADAALAQVADGTYDAPVCAGRSGGEMRVEIADNTIQFYESLCRLDAARTIPGFATARLYDATCSGEGETWTMTMILMQGFDGELIRIEEGLAVTYARCD